MRGARRRRGDLEVVGAAVGAGIVVQDVRERPGDFRDDVQTDAAGFLLGQVDDHVDYPVRTGNVDGNILKIEPARQDGRLQKGLQPALLGVADLVLCWTRRIRSSLVC